MPSLSSTLSLGKTQPLGSLEAIYRIWSMLGCVLSLVIFFSPTEAPLPDPTPTPPNTPKRTRNRPETEPKRSRNEAETELKRSQTEPKWTEIKLSGWDGRGVCRGRGGGGVAREKENHYLSCTVWRDTRKCSCYTPLQRDTFSEAA